MGWPKRWKPANRRWISSRPSRLHILLFLWDYYLLHHILYACIHIVMEFTLLCNGYFKRANPTQISQAQTSIVVKRWCFSIFNPGRTVNSQTNWCFSTGIITPVSNMILFLENMPILKSVKLNMYTKFKYIYLSLWIYLYIYIYIYIIDIKVYENNLYIYIYIYIYVQNYTDIRM
jgi:hypothetical protein